MINPDVPPSTNTQGEGDGSVGSRQTSIDLLADDGDGDSDWDYETNPLTHLSEREDSRGLRDTLEGARMTYREQACSAPASTAGSKVTQDLSGTCKPFVLGKKRPGAKKGVKHKEPTPDLPF